MGTSGEISYISALQQERSGFDLSNANRHLPQNKDLTQFVKTNCRKTGTTIAGCVCKDGVVLAADSRATMGPVIYEKDCMKLHPLAENIYAAGAGSSADLHHVAENLRTDMKLFAEQTKTMPRVSTVAHRLSKELIKYNGHVVVAMVIGGVSPDGSCDLVTVAPDGTKNYQPYLSMGSGGYFAGSILEAGYRNDMTVEEGFELVVSAIRAGVMNDEASGNHVNAIILRKDNPRHPTLRRHVFNPEAPVNKQPITIQPRTTIVTKEIITQIPAQFDINASLNFAIGA